MKAKQSLVVKSELQREVKDYLVASIKKDNDVKLVISVKEAAEMLQLNVTKVYGMIQSKKIPHIRDGNRIIIPVTAFLDWLDREAWKNIA